jgi:hypothetical protein
MSKKLIDNATLSGVQRLMGHSQTLNLYNTDHDICCFEKFVSSLIFSDELLAVDDYKVEYRTSRVRSFPSVALVKPEPELYRNLAGEAADFAAQTAFAFEDSKPVGEALAFFETIKLRPQMRWSIFGSSEYLTLSYLVPNPRAGSYEGSMSAAFGNESGDREKTEQPHGAVPALIVNGGQVQEVKDFVQAFAASNPNFSGSGSNDTLQKIVFGYGWVAERSYFYNALAEHLGAETVLSPLRDAFCETNYRLDYRRELNMIVQHLSENAQLAISSIVSNSGEAKFALRMPFFTAYLLSKCDNIIEAIEEAHRMREEKTIKSCKSIMSNIQHLNRVERLKETNSLLQYLEKDMTNLLIKYSVGTEQGAPFGLSVGFSGINLDFDGFLSKLFRNHRHRPFGKIFRSMANDMLMTERLGMLHDKATKLVREHKDARYSRPSLTPEYMERKASDFGRPARPK